MNLRPVTTTDYPALLACADAAVPFDRPGNRDWLAYRQNFDETTHFRWHVLAEEEGQAVGYGALEQQGDNLATLRLYVVTAHERLVDVGNRLVEAAMGNVPAGTTKLFVREYDQDKPVRDFFNTHGFVETMRVWDDRLTVSEARLEPFMARTNELLALGYEVEARPREPNEMVIVLSKDGDWVGFTVLSEVVTRPGWLQQGAVIFRPKQHRSGLTLPLRIACIQHAQEHGYDTIVAYTPDEAFTTLALNGKLGFQRFFGYVTQEKTL